MGKHQDKEHEKKKENNENKEKKEKKDIQSLKNEEFDLQQDLKNKQIMKETYLRSIDTNQKKMETQWSIWQNIVKLQKELVDNVHLDLSQQQIQLTLTSMIEVVPHPEQSSLYLHPVTHPHPIITHHHHPTTGNFFLSK